MNQFDVDDRFSDALRAELISRVKKSSPAAKRSRATVWVGALAGAGLVGVGAASGLFAIPGGEIVTPTAAPLMVTYAGTATVDLGTPPEGSTGIQLELRCLTPGSFEYPDGASSSCSEVDAANDSLGRNDYTIPLALGQESVTIKTDPESRWQLTAEYVEQERIPSRVNAKGETYGVKSPGVGTPTLIAVMATNGKIGYAYATDIYGDPASASSEDGMRNFSTQLPPHEVTVFQSDGDTQVGVFITAGTGQG